MEKYAAPPGERSPAIRVFLETFARYFLVDLPFQKIIHERKLLLVGQLCILLCNAVQEKIAEYRIYIESVTKCNQLIGLPAPAK